MPRRCICDNSPESHEYHGKSRRGKLTSHRAVVHLNPKCPHSDLAKTTKKHKPKKYRRVPGTKRIIAVDRED